MDESALIRLALQAREHSYSPYSGFAVGAALLCPDGKVFTGCNIESSSFSPTNCAERTAFFKAVSEGNRKFCSIAVIGAKWDSILPFPSCTPCGVCLQVMNEFCSGDFRVILAQSPEQYTVKQLKELLPCGFALDKEGDNREND